MCFAGKWAARVAESLGGLVPRETDPRERRQLSIIRTEREIFERCVAKLPAPKVTKKKQAPPRSKRGEAMQPKPPREEPLDKMSLEKLVETARARETSCEPSEARAPGAEIA